MKMTETKTRTFEMTADDVRLACVNFIKKLTRGAHKRAPQTTVKYDYDVETGEVSGATVSFPIPAKGDEPLAEMFPAETGDAGA